MVKETLLIVENNPTYLKTAQTYFNSLPDINVDLIPDYQTAKAALPNYDGALIDIFIPESKTERLGKEGKKLFEQFENSLKEKKSNCLINMINNDKPLHSSLLRYAKYVLNIEQKEIDKSSLKSIVKKIAGVDFYALDKEGIKNNSGFVQMLLSNPALGEFDTELEFIAREKERGHSPLGIKLALDAEQLKIPYLFTSDNRHNHAPLGEAIKKAFFEGKNSRIIDSSYKRKDEQDFWKGAYKMLHNKNLTAGVLTLLL